METNDQMVMAEWWRRFAALVIDSAVLWIPTMLVTRSLDRPLGIAIWAVVGFTYFTVLNGGQKGQTVGKMVWNIRVRDAATGGPLGPAKAARRYVVPLLALIPILGLVLWVTDGLWPLWDQRRQALHDKLAGSAVVPA